MEEEINELEKVRNLLEAKEGEIILLGDALKNKEEEILTLKAQLNLIDPENEQEMITMKEMIARKSEKPVNDLKRVIEDQNKMINEFRDSVIYPLFKVSKIMGQTRIGRTLSKIIKGK